MRWILGADVDAQKSARVRWRFLSLSSRWPGDGGPREARVLCAFLWLRALFQLKPSVPH